MNKIYYPDGTRLKSVHNTGSKIARLTACYPDGREYFFDNVLPDQTFNFTIGEKASQLPDRGWLLAEPGIAVEFHTPPVYFCNGCSTERVPEVGVVCGKCRAHAAAKEGHVYDGIETVIANLRRAANNEFNSTDEAKTLCRDAAHYLENYWKKLGEDNAATDVDAVIAERGKVYGDPSHSFVNIGLEWTGILQQHYGIVLEHPIPGWLASLMMASFKVHRCARVFHQDNYVDARAYLQFAESDQPKKTP